MDELLPLNAPEYLAAPTPYWERLRDEAPVYWSEEHRLWAVSRYDDVVAVVHAPDRFSSSCGPAGNAALTPFLPLIQHDPPEHGRLRRVLSRAFTPAIVARREPRVREIAADLIEGLRRRASRGEPVDLVRDFSSPLPVSVIAEILGIPESLRERIKLWNDATTVVGAANIDAADRPHLMHEIHQTLAELIESRRHDRRDDLFSALIRSAEDDETQVHPEELVGLSLLLWLAGNETTTNLVSNAALRMQREPALIEILREQPERIKSFVEEMLRLETPVAGLFRVATRDTELRGETLREGDRLLVMYAAANLDPRHFAQPERFDPGRKPNDHVAFSHGIHFCLGSHLARLEARVAFEVLAELLPSARIDAEVGVRIPTGILRGWIRLPMQLS